MTLAFYTNHLINPYNRQSLRYSFERESLIDNDGHEVPVVKGIPNFLKLESLNGLNKKYQGFYDRVSKLNDAAEAVYKLFINLDKLRSEWMADVEVKPGYKVLETSVGTGWNFKVLPKDAEFYGLDISAGMLKQCQKNSTKWNIPMHLVQGNAEYLPFKDESFDSVFHVGGINFFNDRQRAIDEMIRVAKPGTKIVIIDETEELVRKQYQKMPFVNRYFAEKDIDKARLAAPIDLIPSGMNEVEVKLLHKGKMYQLSFRKPATK